MRITNWVCDGINHWRGIQPKPPEKPKLTPALIIWYQYPEDKEVRSFTYTGAPGKSLMAYETTRRFIKWYFGRRWSDSVFIVGYTNRLEWVRSQILRIETYADEKDAYKATKRK